jgi:hypothetical protein
MPEGEERGEEINGTPRNRGAKNKQKKREMDGAAPQRGEKERPYRT